MGVADSIVIRAEQPGDGPEIYGVNREAFGGDDEAKLVDRLREGEGTFLSLVAVDGAAVVGHILFTDVRIVLPDEELHGLGLAPMSVLPPWQRQGVGSRLVREGLEHCREAAASGVVVVGHPEYYPRFGFTVGIDAGIVWDAMPEVRAFMVLGLKEGTLERWRGGRAHYRPEFAGL